MSGQVRTTAGDVEAGTLGRVDYHEHLFQVSPLLPGDELTDEAASTTEAGLLRESGFETMVDATPTGLVRPSRPGSRGRPWRSATRSTTPRRPPAASSQGSTRARWPAGSTTPSSAPERKPRSSCPRRVASARRVGLPVIHRASPQQCAAGSHPGRARGQVFEVRPWNKKGAPAFTGTPRLPL